MTQRCILCALSLLTFAAIPQGAIAQASKKPLVSPEVHADGKVTFRLKAPGAGKVLLQSGEMQDVLKTGSFPLNKEEDGIWTTSVGPLPPGIYDYTFSVDGLTITDPASPTVFGNRQGSRGFVEAPGRAGQPRHDEWRKVPAGAVHVHWYDSAVSGTRRRLHVYTPPGYESGSPRPFPVLYLLHGSGDNDSHWMLIGRANVIVDNLLADGKALPMVVVMPDGHVRERPPGKVDDITRLEHRQAFEKDLLEHVVPLVEANYRVRKDADGKAIAGLSMGSFQALGVGLGHADRFAWIGGFSGAIKHDDPVLATLKADSTRLNSQLKLLWLAIGKQDTGLERKQQLAAALEEMGVRHEYRETEGAHRWSVWRRYLADFVPRLFRSE